ncbi:MAG: 2-oxoglutarate and iron-dependent oxygenase domain-containing protein [Saprospiraceae bacterium]
MSNKEIKRVDYLDYISGDPKLKEKFIKDFGDSFANMGFAIVANHGVSQDLKDNLYDSMITFFNLPDEEKKKYEDVDNFGQRGYISKYKESAKGFKVPDLKEFYHIGQDADEKTRKELNYPENIWVDKVPEFEKYGTEIYNTLEQTGINLLRAIALYLELPENYFDAKVKNGNSILRLLHYFPLTEDTINNPTAVRAAPHGDINLITLLMGASAKGLQAQSLDGEWISVMPKPEEIVINVGDMLARFTNNKLRSTIHQVVNPKDVEKMKKPRYSSPFFLHPHPNMDLTCLESCVSESNPKQYEDMTAGAFLTERLEELGLKTTR